MHEAAGFEKLLMDADSAFHKDPHEAFRLYAPYQSALEDAFAALAHDFPSPSLLSLGPASLSMAGPSFTYFPAALFVSPLLLVYHLLKGNPRLAGEAEAAATEMSEADRALTKQFATNALFKASKSARIMGKLSLSLRPSLWLHAIFTSA